jgi:hypothetical protein
MVVPWENWLTSRRGRLLLDLWSGGLIAFVALLVVAGGSSFALFLFPCRSVHRGGADGLAPQVLARCQRRDVHGRRNIHPAVGQRDSDATRTRSCGRSGARHDSDDSPRGGCTWTAAARADLERALAKEANHRIKNDLQTVADLLLLGRPDGGEDQAFDDTAARIRSIATVHRPLTEAEDHVSADQLLQSIAEGAAVPIIVDADPVALDATTAQKLGIVANELITNAGGFGLQLVRRMVEQGLHGRFELSAIPGGGTRAEVVFPETSR